MSNATEAVAKPKAEKAEKITVRFFGAQKNKVNKNWKKNYSSKAEYVRAAVDAFRR